MNRIFQESGIKRISTVYEDEESMLVKISTVRNGTVLAGISKSASPDMEHTAFADGRRYSWKGYIEVFE